MSEKCNRGLDDFYFSVLLKWQSREDNEWVTGGEPICRYHGRPTRDLVYKYPDRLDCMHDDNLSEIESQGAGARVFAADELDGFLRFVR